MIFLLHTLLLFYDDLKLENNNKKLNMYILVKLKFSKKSDMRCLLFLQIMLWNRRKIKKEKGNKMVSDNSKEHLWTQHINLINNLFWKGILEL